jgi:hypothetical protein
MTTDITFADLDKGSVHDGDNLGDSIQVDTKLQVCHPDNIQIGIQLGPDVTWWKGVQLEPSGALLAQSQDSHLVNLTEIPLTQLQESLLHLWKAEILGFHFDTYVLVDASLQMKGGNQYIFRWIEDDVQAIVIDN